MSQEIKGRLTTALSVPMSSGLLNFNQASKIIVTSTEAATLPKATVSSRLLENQEYIISKSVHGLQIDLMSCIFNHVITTSNHARHPIQQWGYLQILDWTMDQTLHYAHAQT